MLNTWSWSCHWISVLGLIRQSRSPHVPKCSPFHFRVVGSFTMAQKMCHAMFLVRFFTPAQQAMSSARILQSRCSSGTFQSDSSDLVLVTDQEDRERLTYPTVECMVQVPNIAETPAGLFVHRVESLLLVLMRLWRCPQTWS